MSTVRFNSAFTEDVRRTDHADAPNRFTFTGTGSESTGDRERWGEIVDLLLGWLTDTSRLVAEGVTPPDRAVTDALLANVVAWRQRGTRPPDRVMPDDDGGIALEWYREPIDHEVELRRDGSVHTATYREGQLVSRGTGRWSVE